MEEQANAARANLARLDAETRCHLAERERDVYRLLARRWKARLNSLSNQRNDGNISESESVEDAAAAILLGRREHSSIFRFANMFQRFRANAAALDTDDDDDDEEHDTHNHEHGFVQYGIVRMEQDDDDMNEEMLDDDSEDNNHHEDGSLSLESGQSSDETTDAMIVNEAANTAKPMPSRNQVRTVSISESNL